MVVDFREDQDSCRFQAATVMAHEGCDLEERWCRMGGWVRGSRCRITIAVQCCLALQLESAVIVNDGAHQQRLFAMHLRVGQQYCWLDWMVSLTEERDPINR
jgi:hypothetical protein